MGALGAIGVAPLATTDVGVHRERTRTTRLQRLAIALAAVAGLLVVRDLLFPTSSIPVPHLPASFEPLLPAMLLISVLALVMVVPLMAAGRSPHVLFRPDELSMSFDDVRGSDTLVEEVTKTLNLFLAHRSFAEHMGGSPRRAILFEGPPGTGKTYMAKAMAAEAGVPFLFVSSSAFQSMFYGQTNRKIRSYFKALRQHARREGGAIGFIEELDAIGAVRGTGGRHSEGIPGVVNELLIQLQSFEQPPRSVRMRNALIDTVNAWLPPGRRCPSATTFRPTSLSSGPPIVRPISTRPSCVPDVSTDRSTSACRAGPGGVTSSATTWTVRPTNRSSTTRAIGRLWPP